MWCASRGYSAGRFESLSAAREVESVEDDGRTAVRGKGVWAKLVWRITCIHESKRMVRIAMKCLGCVLSIAVLLSTTSSARAQQQIAASTRPTPASPASGNPAAVAGDVPPVMSSMSRFALGSADVIRVNVWKNAELSQTVTVGPDGFVSLPLIGDVHVSGMTANELGKSLVERFSTFIVNPQVTVSVVDVRSRQVYVLGQVAKPGGYPLVAPITVLQLISEAGGLGTYAHRKGIFLLRTVDGVSTKIKFNYDDVIRGNSKQSIELQPGDTVVIP